MSRKDVAAASAEIDRIDAEIVAQKQELERLKNSLAALHNRLKSTVAKPSDLGVTDDDAAALLDEPDAPVSEGLISKLLGLRKKRAENASERQVGRAAIRRAIQLGREQRNAVEEQIRGLMQQRREALIAFTETAHSHVLAGLETALSEASALARVAYALQGGDGRMPWRLDKSAKVLLKHHVHSASGKFEEKQLFPLLPRRPGRDAIRIPNSAEIIAEFRASLADQPKIRRAA